MLPILLATSVILFQGQLVQKAESQIQTAPEPAIAAKQRPDPRTAVPVPAEVRQIEQETLLPDGMLATSTGTSKDTAPRKELSETTGQWIFVGMPDTDEDSVNGLRIFAFTLQPGETLALRLSCEHEAIIMRILKPKANDAMASAISAANFPPTSIRRSRLSIQNPTNRPYTVNLLLYGKVGYPYRLNIERKA